MTNTSNSLSFSLSRVSKMFSGSQFDATTAFSGGGFTSSQPSTLNDSSPAPSNSRETPGLVPVTVKQISEASQSGDEKSNFVINGVDLNNVTLVGMMFEKVERNTDVSFVLDDGTGRIKCRRWINEAFDTKEMEAVMNDMYVRVYGHLKSFQGVKQLVAFSVRQPVTNFDEIPFHFIDCIHNHLRSKIKVEGITSANPSSGSSLETPVKSAPNRSQASNPVCAQHSVDGLKGIDKLVMDYLEQHSDRRVTHPTFYLSDGRGIHVDELSRELKLPIEKIKLSLKTLADDGEIYSTIDDDHYKKA
ncbi:Replication factor A protein 2 [Glycine soja]|uniref:Replication factor A protein 2 n=1 Tax=Glycine soja TaxID=3848 RepID=A0A0B2RHQ0_GLYSO|nr:Replication factor A protein 2 [Glycine soja]